MKRARRKIAAAASAADAATAAAELPAATNAGRTTRGGSFGFLSKTPWQKFTNTFWWPPTAPAESRSPTDPICFQQSRQEVGGHFESFDPKLGDGITAQINEDGAQRNFKQNAAFEGVAGNVLIGRAHGTEMWGLSPEQQQEIRTKVKAFHGRSE